MMCRTYRAGRLPSRGQSTSAGKIHHTTQPFWLLHITQRILELCTNLHSRFDSKTYSHCLDNRHKQREYNSWPTSQNTIRCKHPGRNRYFSAKSKLWDPWKTHTQLGNSPRLQSGFLQVGILHTKIYCSLRSPYQNTTEKCIHYLVLFHLFRSFDPRFSLLTLSV